MQTTKESLEVHKSPSLSTSLVLRMSHGKGKRFTGEGRSKKNENQREHGSLLTKKYEKRSQIVYRFANSPSSMRRKSCSPWVKQTRNRSLVTSESHEKQVNPIFSFTERSEESWLSMIYEQSVRFWYITRGSGGIDVPYTRFLGSSMDFDVYYNLGHIWHKKEYVCIDTTLN